MKHPVVTCTLVIALFGFATLAQTPGSEAGGQSAFRSPDALENISNDVARTARAVESLSKSWAEFTKSFSSNQGLQFDERQRSLLLALEVLNRLETSLGNMQKMRFDLTERQTNAASRIAQLSDDLLPESIDRWVSLRGTTDAEGVRNIRRQTLTKQLREWQTLLIQITRELESTLDDIRRTEMQVKTLRARVFGEAARQLGDF